MSQMCECSFDIHVQEIFGACMCGATLIMLHPTGNMDLTYLRNTLEDKAITYMHTVPTLLQRIFTNFTDYLHTPNTSKYLKRIISSGE